MTEILTVSLYTEGHGPTAILHEVPSRRPGFTLVEGDPVYARGWELKEKCLNVVGITDGTLSENWYPLSSIIAFGFKIKNVDGRGVDASDGNKVADFYRGVRIE